MKAAIFHSFGGPEVLEVVDSWPMPVVKPSDVLVKVKACALNHLDIFVRRGLPNVATALPHVSGGDIAGVVTETGSAVTGIALGTRVLIDPRVNLGDGKVGALGEHVQGGLCEYISVPASAVVSMPDGVSFEEAAALPIAYGTALRMLKRGRVTKDQIVVILGASGGVGTACVQLANLAGAKVIAVSSKSLRRSDLLALGADDVVVASGPEFMEPVWALTGRRGADVVVDCTGAATLSASIRTTRSDGCVLICGATSGHLATIDLRYLWVREISIIGSNAWEHSDIEALLAMASEGTLHPVIDRVVPLDQIHAAEVALESRQVFGKVVVQIDSADG